MTIFLAANLFSLANAATESAVKAPLASRSLLLDVQSTGNTLVAVGTRGHIFITKDNGNVWQQVDAPTQNTLTSVFFIDQNLGWAVGHEAVILRTQDGGNSWEKVYADPKDDRPLFDVWFKDARNGIAIGAYGLILETVDGGDSWELKPFQPEPPSGGVESDEAQSDEYFDEFAGDYHLNQIASSATGHLYMAGEAGHFYRSSDDGKSWSSIVTPYEGSFYGVLPLEGDSLLLFGLRGHLFRSDDAGADWIAITTESEDMLTGGICLNDNTIIIVGLVGTILISKDGGHTFNLHRQTNRVGISSVAQTTDGSLFLVGEQGMSKIETLD
ncbi:MAG: hypothetical protein J7K90_13175 [Desulfuromusa sp.]|nr:hypothetical protein [Desulfuromusa sp.]